MQNNTAGSAKKTAKKRDDIFSFVLTQIVVCGLALLAVLVIKLIGGTAYTAVRDKYIYYANDDTNPQQVFHTVFQAIQNDDQQVQEMSEPNAVSSGSDTQQVIAPYEDTNVDDSMMDPNEGDEVNDAPAETNLNNVHQEIRSASDINQMQLPLVGKVTEEYGMRIHPVTGVQSMHGGMDIAGNRGDAILAAMDGVVRRSTSDAKSGNYLIIDHNDKLATLYAHCDELLVSEGDTVKKGDVIARVGSTGVSTGNHLHFEVRLNGVKLNPRWILSFPPAA